MIHFPLSPKIIRWIDHSDGEIDSFRWEDGGISVLGVRCWELGKKMSLQVGGGWSVMQRAPRSRREPAFSVLLHKLDHYWMEKKNVQEKISLRF